MQYPLEISLPNEIGEDLSKNPDVSDKLTYSPIVDYCLVANSEQEFIDYLGHILKSKNLMQIIKALYKMSDF